MDEIRNPAPAGMYKTLINHGEKSWDNLPTSTGERQISESSTVLNTLPETNMAPVFRGRAPKGNDHIPTIHFQVLTYVSYQGTGYPSFRIEIFPTDPPKRPATPIRIPQRMVLNHPRWRSDCKRSTAPLGYAASFQKGWEIWLEKNHGGNQHHPV